jgi:polygalacturonase/pectin methylesterase-like acyl-CoA thioesterase
MKPRKVVSVFCSILMALPGSLWLGPGISMADSPQTNYLIHDTFDEAGLSTAPTSQQMDSLDGYTVNVTSNTTPWTFNSSHNYAQIITGPTNSSNKVFNVFDSEDSTGKGSTKVSKSFSPQTGLVDAELDFYDNDSSIASNNRVLDLLSSNGKTLVDLETYKINNTPAIAYRQSDGAYTSILPSLKPGQWYHVKVQVDLVNQKVDAYVTDSNNQTSSLLQQNFYQAATDAASILMQTPNSSKANLDFDNVQVYAPATAPTAPTGLTASAGNTQVALSWSSASGATAYNVYRSTESGGPYSIVKSNITGLSYKDTGLTNNTTYYYVVTGVNLNGEGPQSSEVSVTPNDSVPLPKAPTNVKPVSRDSQVSINWDSVPGAANYILQRSTTSGGPYTTLSSSLTSTSYLDTSVTDNTTYYYIVSASSVAGTGDNSSEMSATPVAPLANPTGLTATPGNGKLVLNWSSVGSANTYNVMRSTTDGGPYQTIATGVSGTSFPDTSVANGTIYYYVVTAANNLTQSMISDQVKAIPNVTVPGAPDTPTGFTTTAGDGKVQLSWTSVDGATSYSVKRSTTSDGPYTPVASIKSTSFTDNSVTDGTTYYYVVSASNTNGESMNSDESVVVPGKLIVVAQDGSGDYTTIKDALASIPSDNTIRTVIYIKAGTYHEKVNVTSPNVSFVGEGRDVTTIVNGDYGGTDGQSGNVGGTFNTYTVQASADGFTASNLTIQNSAYPRGTVGTAVALAVKSDQAVFDNIKLLGYQDTLYTGINAKNKGREYFHNCIIEGDVDFIFGEAPAVVFDHDEIITMGAPGTNGGGHVTAAAQLNATDPGYVFINSRIEKDSSAFGSYDLGRPWKNNPSVRFINTWIDSQIIPAGWTSWNVNPNFYGEYNSSGPGANPSSRQMSTQMTADEASTLTIPRIFGGWDPSIPVSLPKVMQNTESFSTPVIAPGSITFDKLVSGQKNAQVTVKTNGDSLSSITNGNDTLDPAADYSVDGNVYTLNKSYLAKLPIGTDYVQFNFTSGVSLWLPVNVVDSTLSEVPTTAPITSIEPVNLVTTAGKAPVMPTLVMAGYGDQSTLALDVTWDSVDPSQYVSAGSYTVKGTVAGTNIPAVANITVKPSSSTPTGDGQDIQSYLTNLPFQANVTVPQFPDQTFNIKDYGAVGDGTTKNTDAFAKAITDCNQAGGGIVDVPAGIWLTGPIQLKSNVNLHLEKGAEILFSSNYNDYLSGTTYQYLLSSNGASNIAITGDGVIDGQGQYWRPVKQSKMTTDQWKNLLNYKNGLVASDGQWYPSQTMVGAKRPYMIDLRHSSNILIDGPKLENSPMFTLSINNDQNVVIRNTTINEPWWAQNGDGMDITSSKNLAIYHNTVNAGDDGIAMKSSGTIATSNVVVADNIVFHAHGGFVVGSNTGGGINNIMVRDNQYIDTDAGIKLKTYVGNGGPIQNIWIDNIKMQNIATDAIHFDTYYNGDNTESQNAEPGGASVPEYSNVHISNISADGVAQAVYIDALPHVPLHDVDMTNVTIHAQQGFTSTNATNVTLKNVNITADSGPVYTLNNSTNFVFDHVPVPASTGTFLYLQGSSNGVELLDTNTFQARVPFQLDPGISQDAIKVVDDEQAVTSAQVSPLKPDGQNNWYAHPVSVTLSATDNFGVASTLYSINGGAWQQYSGPFTLNNDGNYTIAYYSTDTSGNIEKSKDLTFQIDQTAPTVSYSGNAGVYTVDQNVSIKCTTSDLVSGVASSTCKDITGPAYSFNLGTNTFSAQAMDHSGNTGSGTTQFTVKVTFDSLANLTKQFVDQSGEADSLVSKVEAAKDSQSLGNNKAMDNQLDAYIHELSAQRGKALTADQASLLTQFATLVK